MPIPDFRVPRKTIMTSKLKHEDGFATHPGYFISLNQWHFLVFDPKHEHKVNQPQKSNTKGSFLWTHNRLFLVFSQVTQPNLFNCMCFGWCEIMYYDNLNRTENPCFKPKPFSKHDLHWKSFVWIYILRIKAAPLRYIFWADDISEKQGFHPITVTMNT